MYFYGGNNAQAYGPLLFNVETPFISVLAIQLYCC